jgi:hypothetical protein
MDGTVAPIARKPGKRERSVAVWREIDAPGASTSPISGG